MAAPTVTTGAASNVTPWQADLAGTITDLGGANVSERGFQVNTSASADGARTIKITATVSSVPQAISMTVNQLTEDMTWYFRAYAVNGDGTGYGSWVSFTTLPAGSIRTPSVILYRRGTSGTITYTFNSSSKLKDYSVEWDENRPMKATIWIDNSDPTSTANLLNSSCAAWTNSVTGALVQGDFLEVKFYRLDGVTLDSKFYGKIIELSPESGGFLKIVASCGLKSLDKIDHGRPIYTNYRDHACFDIEVSNGRRRMKSFNDNNVVLERAAVALADMRLDLDNGAAAYTYDLGDTSHYVAQKFIPTGNAIVGVKFDYKTSKYSKAGSTAKMMVEIRLANEDGTMSDVVLATGEANVGANDSRTTMQYDLCTAGAPVWDRPGIGYFLKIYPNIAPDDPTGYLGVYCNGAATRLGADVVSDTYTGWAGAQIIGQIDQANYEDIDLEECSVDETNNYLYFAYDESDVDAVDTYYTVYRGMSCHYYNTVTGETIVNSLIERSGLLDAAASANMDRTWKVFDPRGKNILESIRDVLDQFETSGSWDGYQKTIGTYLNSGVWTAKCGKRAKTTDTVYQVLCYSDDTVNDWERMIVGTPQLKKTTTRRYSAIRVTGKDYFGDDIVSTVSDGASATSLVEALPEGFSEVLEVQSDVARTQADLDSYALALLESMSRSVWEGGITLNGHHFLWDADGSSDNFGSGKIISLKWSPLGISITSMKVKAVVIHPTTTEIYVTNPDPLTEKILNQYKNLKDKVNQTSGENVSIRTFVSSVISASAGYMELQDSAGNPLEEHIRVVCTVVTSSTGVNLKKFIAYIPSWNALGTVEQVEIFDALTGGNSVVSQDLYRTSSSITIDERADKHRDTRLVVEVLCKAS